MKKIKRKTMIEQLNDTKPKMHTLYEYFGKCGTHQSTRFWFVENPKVGDVVIGVCEDDHYSPYMGGTAFQYATWKEFYIADIGFGVLGDADEPFVYASRF